MKFMTKINVKLKIISHYIIKNKVTIKRNKRLHIKCNFTFK